MERCPVRLPDRRSHRGSELQYPQQRAGHAQVSGGGYRFFWGDDRPPRTPWHDTLIYELHVRGFTMRHPDVPANLRGSYAGLACGPVIDYLKALEVTAVELLPIQYFIDERHLLDRGLRNYWGYSPLGYFARTRAMPPPTIRSLNSRAWSSRCTRPASK